MACGDPSGSTQASTGVVSLAVIGAEWLRRRPSRVVAAAQAQVVKELSSTAEFASVNSERALALLSDKPLSFSREDLVGASQAASDLDLSAALASLVYQRLPFDGDDEATKRVLRLALEAGMRVCAADDVFKNEVGSTQLLHLVQAVAQSNDRLEVLIEQTADKARELHLTEQLFISLARRINDDVADIDQAHRELERVVEVAAGRQIQSDHPGDIEEAVTAILAKVDKLNDEGEIDSAAALIAEEEARVQAGAIRVYEKGIRQAVLTRDAEAACSYELKKISLGSPKPAAQYNAISRAFSAWLTRGRDQGLNFDLEVAIGLAKRAYASATASGQLIAARFNLGNALLTLGERERTTDRLEEAVSVYRALIEEQIRERSPLKWATFHNNLGKALQTLGSREIGTERLEEAVIAFGVSLEGYTRERVPLYWAMAQTNLGSTLAELGERDIGIGRLLEAVTAFRAALEENTRERVPMEWALTQNNLGNVLLSLHERDSDTERLAESIAAFRAALQEHTRERSPLEWAMIQGNLGNALSIQGTRENDSGLLEEAVEAHSAALEEYTRDRVPMDWAATQNNLGNALLTLGELKQDSNLLKTAISAFRASLEERTRERTPLDWATTQDNLGNALSALGALEIGTQALQAAVVAYNSALSERTRERVPPLWATSKTNLAIALLALADRSATTEAHHYLSKAIEHVEAALEVLHPESTGWQHSNATKVRHYLLRRLGNR